MIIVLIKLMVSFERSQISWGSNVSAIFKRTASLAPALCAFQSLQRPSFSMLGSVSSTTQLISFLEAWAWVFSGDVVSVRAQLLTVKDCYAAITMSSFSREEHELYKIMPRTLHGCGMDAPLHSYFGTAVNMVTLVLAAATLSLTALLLLILRRHRNEDQTK